MRATLQKICRRPRGLQTLPKFLTMEQVDALLAAPDIATPKGLRDRALIEVLYATGLRVSELVGLRQVDVRLDEGYVQCLGKGSKERIVPLGEEASGWVKRYVRDVRPGLLRGRQAPWLFLNARGARLSRVGFWKLLKEYGTRAGVRSEPDARTCCGTHSRRTCSIGAQTSAPSRPCSDMQTSRPRRFTRMCSRRGCGRCTTVPPARLI